MKREDIIQYWIKTAQQDYAVMNSLFAKGHYIWCLFAGHLVVEKLLKACYVKSVNVNAPRIHDLKRLAILIGLPLTESEERELLTITSFNIAARYPDYKLRIFQKAKKGYAEEQVGIIKKWRKRLLQKISKG